MTFARYLSIYHSSKPEDWQPTETPGYWERKLACGGAGVCREQIHGFMFNEGGIKHTVQFEDCIRVKGRFAPRSERYKTWLAARAQASA